MGIIEFLLKPICKGIFCRQDGARILTYYLYAAVLCAVFPKNILLAAGYAKTLMRVLMRWIRLTFLVSCFFLTGCLHRAIDDYHLRMSQFYFNQGYYQKALHSLWAPVSQGDPAAEYALGYLYYYGYGTTQDLETGYFWIKKSADQHYPLAQIAIRRLSNPT